MSEYVKQDMNYGCLVLIALFSFIICFMLVFFAFRDEYKPSCEKFFVTTDTVISCIATQTAEAKHK